MKQMRKLLILVVMACLIVSMTACGKKNKDGAASEETKISSPFVGSWTIKSFEAMGVEFSVDQLDSLGLSGEELSSMQSFAIEIKDDSTFAFTSNGATIKGEWTGSDSKIDLTFSEELYAASEDLAAGTGLTATMENDEISMDMTQITGVSIQATFMRAGSTPEETAPEAETETTSDTSNDES